MKPEWLCDDVLLPRVVVIHYLQQFCQGTAFWFSWTECVEERFEGFGTDDGEKNDSVLPLELC